jgi:transposase
VQPLFFLNKARKKKSSDNKGWGQAKKEKKKKKKKKKKQEGEKKVEMKKRRKRNKRSCYYLPGQILEMLKCNLLKPHLHLLQGFVVVVVAVAVVAAKELGYVGLWLPWLVFFFLCV